MSKIKVHVFLKPGVLDVQGKAVEGALQGLGWTGVSNARVGKLIEFDDTNVIFNNPSNQQTEDYVSGRFG